MHRTSRPTQSPYSEPSKINNIETSIEKINDELGRVLGLISGPSGGTLSTHPQVMPSVGVQCSPLLPSSATLAHSTGLSLPHSGILTFNIFSLSQWSLFGGSWDLIGTWGGGGGGTPILGHGWEVPH